LTLKLTPSEYENLTKKINDSRKRRSANRCTTPPGRENEIVRMEKARKSNMYIRRVLRTSDDTINKIKRKYGLWGV